MLATLLRPGAWRYNISDLYSAGAPRPWLVMVGEAAFAVGLAALALGLRRALPPSDHRLVGSALLVLASMGATAGALARNRCEESVPRCEGQTFATASDWVHGIGSLAEILGIAGAALVLSATMSRRWGTYSVMTAGVALVALLAWGALPYPWVGTAERFVALVLVGWVAAIGSQLTTEPRALRMVRAVSEPSAATADALRIEGVSGRRADVRQRPDLTDQGSQVQVGVFARHQTVTHSDDVGSVAHER